MTEICKICMIYNLFKNLRNVYDDDDDDDCYTTTTNNYNNSNNNSHYDYIITLYY